MNAYAPRLAPFGIPEESVIELDDSSAEALPYAALLKAQRTSKILEQIRCVVTWQGAPLAYIVEARGLTEEDAQRVRRVLALRGDAPYLGLLDGGRLTALRLSLDDATIDDATLEIYGDDAPDKALWAYNELSAGWEDTNDTPKKRAERVEITTHIGELLDQALDAMVPTAGMSLPDEDKLSMVGRALFLRFLADRGLLPAQYQARRDTLFVDPDSARDVSEWLDKTFNGDLLPIGSLKVWDMLAQPARSALDNILRGSPGGQLLLGWGNDWRHVHLAHVPVGVLSQVYQGFAHRVDPVSAKGNSVYYTPWRIAERMVAESFVALRRAGRAIDARVLDPSAGAGVFLHICFRQLVYERRLQGETPTTASLRAILTDQLRGFDLSEGALRFAALGLYLLAIELDPNPEPVEKLGFPNLRATTLRLVTDGQGDGTGSLGAAVGPEHQGQYDLVIGNPPWGKGLPKTDAELPGAGGADLEGLSGAEGGVGGDQPVLPAAKRGRKKKSKAEVAWALIAEKVNDVAKERLKRPTPLPDEALDLAFLWRALGWAKPGGQIAFALHGRILHQQTHQMPRARADLWEAATVTGVIDGARVREPDVWKDVRAHFCLIFVKNSKPGWRSGCLVTAIEEEPRLNAEGRFRLSADDSTWIAPGEVAEEPALFKMILRGTALDRELMRRLRGVTTFGEYWRELQAMHGAAKMHAGKGVSVGDIKKLRERQERGERVCPSDTLNGLPMLSKNSNGTLRAPREDAEVFWSEDRPLVDEARTPALWAPPQLIVRETVLVDARRLAAMCNHDKPLAFVQSFRGWSAAGHPDGDLLVKVLALQLRSKVALWTMLMRSGSFGVERERVEMKVMEDALVVRLEDMTTEQRAEAEALYSRLADAEDSSESWQELDVWTAGLYGLGEADLETINDTLKTRLPFAKERAAARSDASRSTREAFLSVLQARLTGWAKQDGKTIVVEELPLSEARGWRVVHLWCPELAQTDPDEAELPKLLAIADGVGATELVHPVAPGRLLIARLPYQRGWTRSRALLLARRVVHQHLDHLLGESAL